MHAYIHTHTCMIHDIYVHTYILSTRAASQPARQACRQTDTHADIHTDIVTYRIIQTHIQTRHTYTFRIYIRHIVKQRIVDKDLKTK